MVVYKTRLERPLSSTEATPTPVDVHPTATLLCIVITSLVSLEVCIELAVYARVCSDHSSCLFRISTCIQSCCAFRLTYMLFSPSPVDSQQYPPTYSIPDYATRDAQNDVRGDARYLTRTPSPTPSEAEVLSPQKKKRRGFLLALLNPETFKDPKELSTCILTSSRPHVMNILTVRLVITAVIIAIVVLFIVYQQKIVEWLRPFADWMRR